MASKNYCRNAILLWCFCTAAADTMFWGQRLSGNQTIISEDRVFELGFFRPGKSPNYYIGIWYNNRPEKTVVWVANREKPVTDASSSEFKIYEDGNLVLLNSTKTIIWSSSLHSMQQNTTKAVLLDTGNLVLMNISDSNVQLWQSFDYPADTWLPGGWFGWNPRTRQYVNITSWRSPDDPAPGYYTFGVDPRGSNQLIQAWKGNTVYWNSGVWNGQYFDLVPELIRNKLFNYTYVEQDRYMTYSLTQPNIITRFVMNISGEGIQMGLLNSTPDWVLGWSQPRMRCQVYLRCGPFSICNDNGAPLCQCMRGFEPVSKDDWNSEYWNGGCKRRTKLACFKSSGGEADRFLMMSDVQLPLDSESLPHGNISSCKEACLQNCSCVAYAFDGGKCLIWKDELRNLRQPPHDPNSTGSIYIRLAASELRALAQPKRRNGAKLRIIISVILLSMVVLTTVTIFAWRHQRKARNAISKKAKEGSLALFTYRELQILTKNFSERLGGGGFGSVYKGWLPGLLPIAIKKLEGERQGEKQFRAEVRTIATIQHANLVRLRGFCCEGDKRLLVYDYMQNGSLDTHLFQHNLEPLRWEKRYLIAIGTAKALAYLHEQCRDCIIHCDVKPENVLLDEEFCPKVADFGMAKLVGREISKVLTTMRGTIGYLAPEWISGLPITPKVDVYSYGMMLFEIISGRRNTMHDIHGNSSFFPILAAKKIGEGDFASLLDEKLQSDANLEELQTACKVACWCIQDDESHRPSMGQVVLMLEGSMEVNEPPIPSYLQNLVNM